MAQAVPRSRDGVGKALRLLWAVLDTEAEGERQDIRSLAQRLHISPASVYRTLITLQRHALLQSAGFGRYRVGMELYRLALQVGSRVTIRDVALPVMQDLMAECNETVFLTLYDPSRREMMFVAAVNSSHPLRYIVPMNEWVPIHAGASGFAILAFLPDEERRAIYAETKLRPLTPNTITDPVALEAELERVRARGYAISCGQRNVGAVSVVAPLWDARGAVIGGVAVSMPEARFQRAMEPPLAKLVLKAAAAIMTRTGGHPRAVAPAGSADTGRRGIETPPAGGAGKDSRQRERSRGSLVLRRTGI